MYWSCVLVVCTGSAYWLPLDAAEGVLVPLLGLDLEVEGARGGGASGEVDAGDLLEAQVDGRLVHVDEAALQRVEQPGRRLVGAGDALRPRVPDGGKTPSRRPQRGALI